jgi:hypothetical protein
MGSVLTESSTVVCKNQGTVQLRSGQSKLSVNGSKVLVEGDLDGAQVSGCTTVTDANTGALQCSAVLTALGGVAGKLKVSGKGVLLESIQGLTGGTVGGTPQDWSVQNAGQTKLTAS